MNALQRRIYSAVLRLHPAEFRDHFGRDMERDFADALPQRGFAPLLGDAMLSLAWQWQACALAGPELELPVASHPFLAGQYQAIRLGGVNAFDLGCASVLSVALLLMIGYAASVPNRRVIADVQTVRVAHDGGIDATPHSLGAASDQGRREARVFWDAGAASGYGTGNARMTGPVHLRTESTGFSLRPHGRVHWQAPSLGDALLQFALISAVVWLTSFLFRRTRGVGARVFLGTLGLLGVFGSLAFGAVPKSAMHAQILHPAQPLPSFEVTTVRPWQPRPMPPPPPAGMPDTRPPMPRKIDPMGGRGAEERTDRVHMITWTVSLIESAFNFPLDSSERIIGAPEWVGSNGDRYEVQCKIEAAQFAAMQAMTAQQRREQVAWMEQSLLADRFKLKAHFETREMPVYALVISKGGAKLTPAKEGEVARLSSLGNETTGTAVTLDQFVHSPLLRPDSRTVIDQTGLEGAYDFTIKGEGAEGPSFFTLIQEQLGLKLVPTKAPVEVIIIDHIEKPSEN
ncbi:MAG TPA: TIGR03435 family protein [Acidobacteriaceae bacterium]|jgi:uncharacterized protein (TIGR03435 family)